MRNRNNIQISLDESDILQTFIRKYPYYYGYLKSDYNNLSDHAIANKIKNQSVARDCDGMELLIRGLHHVRNHVESILRYHNIPH